MTRPTLESVNCSLIAVELPENGQPVTVDVLINNTLQSLVLIQVDGKPKLFLNQCPHQGRRLDYAPGKFLCKNQTLVCAAHGAVFAMASGLCVQGPCRGESLTAYEAQWQPDGQLAVFWP